MRILSEHPAVSTHRFLLFAIAFGAALVLIRFVSVFLWPIPFQVDEAQYLGWSKELAFGYYSKPPLVAWMLATNTVSCNFLGIESIEGCARMGQSVALGIASIFVGLTAKALFDRPSIAILSGLLIVCSPLFGFYSLFATTDAWLLLCWSAALYFFVCATGGQHKSTLVWILCGLCVGLGLLAKYSAGLFVISAFIWLLINRQLLWPGPWIALTVAFLLFSPNLIWNFNNGFPTFSHHIDISQVADFKKSNWSTLEAFGSLSGFLAAQFLILSPFALWSTIKTKPSSRARFGKNHLSSEMLLIIFMVPIFLVMFLQAILSRAHANWAAPAYVSMAIYASWIWASRLEGAKAGLFRSVASIVFGVALSALFVIIPKLAFYAPAIIEIRAVEKIRGWKEVANGVLAISQEQNLDILAGDRSLLAAIHAYGPIRSQKILAFSPASNSANHYTWFNNIADVPIPDGRHYLLLTFNTPDQDFLDRHGLFMHREIKDLNLERTNIGDQKLKILAYEVSRLQKPK